jgi:hypothetical protein
MRDQIERWLAPFELDEVLHEHVLEVFVALPTEARQDLMDDWAFVLCDYEPNSRGMNIPVKLGGRGQPGRSVVLKRTLRNKSDRFVRWVIAHELAHAVLRNKGTGDDADPERAANALAAEWGFPCPAAWYL